MPEPDQAFTTQFICSLYVIYMYILVLTVNPVRTNSAFIKIFRTEPTRPKTLSNQIDSIYCYSKKSSSRFGSIEF